jgi:kumamolisin
VLRQRLDGSERIHLAGARPFALSRPDEPLEVTVVLRRPRGPWMHEALDRLAAANRTRQAMPRERFAELHGAAARDVDAVLRFARHYGLSVEQVDRARRTLVIAGSIGQFNEAFGIELKQFRHDGGAYRGHMGAILLPQDVYEAIEAVLGLDNRPHARAHFRLRPPAGHMQPSYTPRDVATLYGFPDGDGARECVALIELGGGYRLPDLAKYLAKLQLPLPTVVPVSVDHATNRPTGDPSGPDGEVMLDLEVVSCVAPRATLAVYFAPNTEAGFVNAVTTAIHDVRRRPSVLSIGWGSPEEAWSPQAIRALDAAFQDAAVLGVSVVVASGDGGSADGLADGKDHVDFPASSPHVLACGGTTLRTSNGLFQSETVWNSAPGDGAAGGGVSHVFPIPQWQRGLSVQRDEHRVRLTMRGVPDVSADADPGTGYEVRVDGYDAVVGGTSVVAPLWAGLIARINGRTLVKLGYLNPLLYAHGEAFHDVTSGDNGDYHATSGWDACTGLGSPIGHRIAAAAGVRESPGPQGKE